MKRLPVIIFCLVMVLTRCTPRAGQEHPEQGQKVMLPKVLFVTSGITNENAKPAPGIVVANQAFNRMGIMTRLAPRDILFNEDELEKYSLIILSTFPGYHDADRQYSLSYMTDEELQNLAVYVHNGGYLISGDNVGRNYSDGTDRVSVFQQLNEKNWALSRCFGVTLSEKNMTGYDLEGIIPGYFDYDISRNAIEMEGHEFWTLTPDSFLSDSCKTLGYWKLGQDSACAMTENSFGKGKAFLLATSGLLHPKNDGGLWGESQIDAFYQYVISRYKEQNDVDISLNPWPMGYEYAFCVSLNARGDVEQYKRIFKLMKDEKIDPVIFVSGSVNNNTRTLLGETNYPLASGGFGYINHTDLVYPQALEDILLNENSWKTRFRGFRFPFTAPGYWGLMALCEQHYDYESSIGADNIEFFHGSIVPYNLVISNEGFYRGTDLLEIAPTYHDDYYFLTALNDVPNPDTNRLNKEIAVYTRYLENFWNYAVKPYDGLMVYLGHPEYVGYSDSTLSSLKTLIRKVKHDNTWITTMNEVAGFRKNLDKLVFAVSGINNGKRVEISGPSDLNVKDVCLVFEKKVKKASTGKGQVKVMEKGEGSLVVFDAFGGQVVTVHFD